MISLSQIMAPHKASNFLVSLLAVFFVLTLSSCSHSGKTLPDEVTKPKENQRLETIAIVGTNDIHGALAPMTLKTREKDGKLPTEYQKGGAAIFASQMKILKSEFEDRLMILDAGDEFQGSIESNTGEGSPMVQFFNQLGIQAAAIGNHEFDFGPVGPDQLASPEADVRGALKTRMKEAKYPYLSANLEDEKTGVLPTDFPNTFPSQVFQVGKLKVGVIGLTTIDTPTTTRAKFVEGLKFTSLADATVREAKKLRDLGAQLILVTAHAGLYCKTPTDYAEPTRLRRESEQTSHCDTTHEISELLNRIPPHTVDGVISGHTHTLVHHWVNQTPVIQGGTRNQYFNVLYLTYDWNSHKVIRERTRIEGPVPICPLVFENQGNCNGDQPAPPTTRGPLVAGEYHGVKISPDAEMLKTLEPAFAKTNEIKKRIVGTAFQTLEHVRTAESPLGNLITDAMRDKMKVDVALMNGGGIRANIPSGPISYESLFRTLPFDNAVSVLELTGRELKILMRIAESGSRAYFSFSGLKLTVLDLNAQARSEDLNLNGKIEPWEVNRIIEMSLDDGSAIEDRKTYRLATIDFLVTGGDDLGWIMSQIPKARINLNAGPFVRDVVEEYLTKQGTVNTPQGPLVSPTKPRLEIVKALPSKCGPTGKCLRQGKTQTKKSRSIKRKKASRHR